MRMRMLAGMIGAAALLSAAGSAAAQVVVIELGEAAQAGAAQDPGLSDPQLAGGPEARAAWVSSLATASAYDPLFSPYLGWEGPSVESRPVIRYDVEFNAGVLPEPASWGMMLAGFFGAGFLLRRYKQQMQAAWPA